MFYFSGRINGKEVLQNNVLSLMATLDGYIFAVDITDMNYTLLSCELKMMLTEAQKPLLILCCSCDDNVKDFDLNQFVSKMELNEIASCRPWAAFKVNVSNMLGVEMALAWILHHLQNVENTTLENRQI